MNPNAHDDPQPRLPDEPRPVLGPDGIGFFDGPKPPPLKPSPAPASAANGLEKTADASPSPSPPAVNRFVTEWSEKVLGELNKVFVGQRELVWGVLVAILAEGHVLLESVPGLGKTLLVRALGKALGCSHKRIQFTPDMMPSDITGSPVFDQRIQDFRFRPGPVFAQLLLADEVNRSPAKTHAALLETMQEARVTIDGTVYPLEKPFLVLATQNPIESEGTYNLPEAQLDRFLFKLVINYPSAEEEANILRLYAKGDGPDLTLDREVRAVTNPAEVIEAQRQAAAVIVDDRVVQYITALIRKTRQWPELALGASPRAGVALLKASRAAAALAGRDFTIPDDVQDIAVLSLRHRVILTPEAEVEGAKVDDVLEELIKSIPAPRS